MEQILNTLYVTTDHAYVHVDHQTLRVDIDGKTELQVPLMHLGSVVVFGNVLVSPKMIHRCTEDGREIVFLDRNGRFKGRVVGPTSGNVLLRQAQYAVAADQQRTASIARNMVAGKIQNARGVVQRAARDAGDEDDAAALRACAKRMADILPSLPQSEQLDQIRGLEGVAARTYFGAFRRMVCSDREAFGLTGRNKRPPRDRINALLSFLYVLLLNDCTAAAEGVGLDPQVGYLHALRPGRAALALDLMEEFRAPLADRLALTLVNRRQVRPQHFVERPGGAVHLDDDGRKQVVIAYQKRKQEAIHHQLLQRKMPFGLAPHVQARLLARVLRGDMDEYVPARCR